MLHEAFYEDATVLRSDGRLEYRFGGGWCKLIGVIGWLSGSYCVYDGARDALQGSLTMTGLFELLVLGPVALLAGIVIFYLRRGVVLDSHVDEKSAVRILAALGPVGVLDADLVGSGQHLSQVRGRPLGAVRWDSEPNDSGQDGAPGRLKSKRLSVNDVA